MAKIKVQFKKLYMLYPPAGSFLLQRAHAARLLKGLIFLSPLIKLARNLTRSDIARRPNKNFTLLLCPVGLTIQLASR